MHPRTASRRMPLVLATLCLVTASATAQDRPRTEALIDLKGKTHLPLEVKDAKAVVLFFVTNDCPIANYYTSEINAIVKDYAAQPVRFYVVHADPDLTPAAAADH